MQIELIETFLDLFETSSFNQTAERLGVTQSTVSSRVQALEAALGARLFARSRAGTRPTPAGHSLHRHALALRHEWNQARHAVRSAGGAGHTMRVAMQHDLGAEHVGEWIARFREALPSIALYVELDYSSQMASDLLSGKLDFALLYTPLNQPDLYYEVVGETVYRMVSNTARRLQDIDMADYLFANYSPAFDRSHREIIGHEESAFVASGQNAAICNLLESLGGTAYVLSGSAKRLVDTGRFHAVEDAPPIRQTVHAAMHVRHRRNRTHLRLLQIVRDMLVDDARD